MQTRGLVLGIFLRLMDCPRASGPRQPGLLPCPLPPSPRAMMRGAKAPLALAGNQAASAVGVGVGVAGCAGNRPRQLDRRLEDLDAWWPVASRGRAGHASKAWRFRSTLRLRTSVSGSFLSSAFRQAELAAWLRLASVVRAGPCRFQRCFRVRSSRVHASVRGRRCGRRHAAGSNAIPRCPSCRRARR